jgi:hypothetical protein
MPESKMELKFLQKFLTPVHDKSKLDGISDNNDTRDKCYIPLFWTYLNLWVTYKSVWSCLGVIHSLGRLLDSLANIGFVCKCSTLSNLLLKIKLEKVLLTLVRVKNNL